MKVKDMPDIVQIAVTNRCNLMCGMCMRKTLNVPYEDMELNVYKAIIDKLPVSVKAVILTGWGEPLFHPDIWDMVSFTKKKGFITHIITNGLLLNQNNQRMLFKSGLDSIIVSIEAINAGARQIGIHPYYREVIKNIKGLVSLRKGRATPHISLCVILHKGRKRSILEIVKFAQRLDIDTVHLGRLNNALDKKLKRYSPKEEIAIWKQCLKLKKNRRPNIIITHLQYLGLQKLYPIDEFCPKIYNFLYVNVKGEATACCNLPNYIVGDILGRGLKAVWNGRRMADFRTHQKDICKNMCNIYN